MNPGSFPWAHWDCPTITPYAPQEDLYLNSTSHRPDGFLFHERGATSSHSTQAHWCWRFQTTLQLIDIQIHSTQHQSKHFYSQSQGHIHTCLIKERITKGPVASGDILCWSPALMQPRELGSHCPSPQNADKLYCLTLVISHSSK